MALALALAATVSLWFLHPSPDDGIFLLLALALAGACAWPASKMAACHIGQLALLFAIPSMIKPPDDGYGLALVAGWALALAAGTLLASPRPPGARERAEMGSRPMGAHILFGFVLTAVTLGVNLSGAAGIGAQLETGVSSASGLSGILSSLSTTWAVAVFVASVTRPGRSWLWGCTLLLAQILSVTQSGFRGLALNIIIAVGIAL
ncbi:MAG: hypothetical protein ACXVAT_20155, partial [Isosphaeraceae bacterium]